MASSCHIISPYLNCLFLTDCVILGKLISLFVLQCPHIYNGNSNSTYIRRLLWRLNEIIPTVHIKHSAWCLVHNEPSTNISLYYCCCFYFFHIFAFIIIIMSESGRNELLIIWVCKAGRRWTRCRNVSSSYSRSNCLAIFCQSISLANLNSPFLFESAL